MKLSPVHFVVVALLGPLVAMISTAWGQPTQLAPPPASQPAVRTPAALIKLEGMIDETMQRRLTRQLADARALGVKAVILQINTNGGLVESGLAISRLIKTQRELTTIAYIDPKAYSCGALVAMACNQIVMAPGAVIGDAAPIVMSSDHSLVPLPPAERAKAQSPILADFRDSAVRNGYSELLVEAMVVPGQVIFAVQDSAGGSGAVRIVAEQEYFELLQRGWAPLSGVPSPLNSTNSLLTIYTPTAVAVGLARGTAPTATALANERGLSIIQSFAPSWGDALIETLNSPIARFVLLVVFLLSLYIALHAPGHGMAEVAGTISLAVLLGVPLLTGYAQWWEIVAILIGMGLLALEVFVIPGFGVVGVLGIILIIGGFILTFAGTEPGGLPGLLPKLQGTWDGLLRGLYVVTSGLVCSLLLSLWLRRYLPKLPYFNRLILAGVGSTGMSGDQGTTKAPEDTWPFLGTTGKAVSELKPGGVAEFPYGDDKRVAAVVSDGGYVEPGSPVKVREISGNRIVVRPVPGGLSQ